MHSALGLRPQVISASCVLPDGRVRPRIRLPLAVAMAVAMLGACATNDSSCVVNSECPVAMACVNGRCGPGAMPDSGPRDSSAADDALPGVDAEGSDASETDTGITDAISMDVALTDAGDAASTTPDAGAPSYCDESRAWFCEDFEDVALPGWGTSAEVDAGATTEVSSDRSHTGVSALRTEIRVDQARHAWNSPLPGTVGTGTIYARAWMYVEESNFARANIGMWGLGERRGAFDSINAKVVDGQSGIYDTVAAAPSTGSAIRYDQWQCWLLRVDIGNSGGEIRLSVDNETHLMETGRDTLFGEGFAGMFVGSVSSRSITGPITYWLDTVEVDTRPLACP